MNTLVNKNQKCANKGENHTIKNNYILARVFLIAFLLTAFVSDAQTQAHISNISTENFIAMHNSFYLHPELQGTRIGFPSRDNVFLGIMHGVHPGIKTVTITRYQPVTRWGEVSKGDIIGSTTCSYDREGRLIEVIAGRQDNRTHRRIIYEGNRIVEIRAFNSQGVAQGIHTYSLSGGTMAFNFSQTLPSGINSNARFVSRDGGYEWRFTTGSGRDTYNWTHTYLHIQYSNSGYSRGATSRHSRIYTYRYTDGILLLASDSGIRTQEYSYLFNRAFVNNLNLVSQLIAFQGNISDEGPIVIVEYEYEFY